ncbi:hypothetical protein D3C85_1539930 [compost metagenome]
MLARPAAIGVLLDLHAVRRTPAGDAKELAAGAVSDFIPGRRIDRWCYSTGDGARRRVNRKLISPVQRHGGG